MTPISHSETRADRESRSDEMERRSARRDSDRMAQAVMDELTAMVAVLDERGRIVSANRAWRAFVAADLPLPLALAEGADYPAAWDAAGDGARRTAEGLRAVLQGENEAFAQEFSCPVRGEEHWFSMRVTRIPGARRGRVVVSHEDITDRRRAEEALRRRVDELAQATQRLEQKNAELDQFAYITSHDLKAPLRGIANLSRWIEEDIEGEVNAPVREHLEMMRGRVNRMEAMIEGILQYSRIGRVQVKSEAVDVDALLSEVVELLDPPTDFTVEIGPEMPIIVTERVRLQQVFLNLIGNAVKHHHAPAHGRVSVSVRDLGDAYEFTVADDGPGIARQYHEKVFVIFQTLQARDRMESTGVGLSLVKKIVQTQGGEVRLTSDIGRGASFCFTWPKTRP